MHDRTTYYNRSFRIATLSLFIALALAIVVSVFFPVDPHHHARGSVEGALHGVVDLLGILLTALVTVLVWHTLANRSDARLVIFGSFFAVITILDVGHFFTQAGLLGTTYQVSDAQAENFWLLSRVWTAVALLLAAYIPTRLQFRTSAKILFWVLSLIFIAFTFVKLVGNEFYLVPLLVLEPVWLPWPLDLTHLILGALLLSSWGWFQKASASQRMDNLYLFVAAALVAMSEIYYTNPEGHLASSFLGEIYELIGIAFTYRAIVVTGIKAPFAQLDQLTRRLQATIDAIPDMIFEISSTGAILSYYSDHARSKLMLPPAAFLGRRFQDVLPPRVASTVDLAINDITQSGFTNGRTYQLDIDGEAHYFELSGSLLAGSHREKRFLILARDITPAAIAKRELVRSQRILQAALDNMPSGVAVTRETDGIEFEYMNQNFASFFRTSAERLMGHENIWEVIFDAPDARHLIQAEVQRAMASGDQEQMIWENVPITRKGEDPWYVTVQKVPVPEEGLYITLVDDVTHQLQREEELRVAATAFSSQEGMVITDANQRIIQVNASFEEITGFRQEELQGKTPAFFASEEHDDAFFAAMWERIHEQGSWQGEIWNRRKSGQVYPQSVTISAVKNKDEKITHYVAGYIDISEIKEAEERISQLSYYDSLTSLPNRDRMYAYLNDLQLTLGQHGGSAAIIMIDLDHFKTINDTMGHESGDELLLQVTERISPLVVGQGKLFRYGGDEFIAILSRLDADREVAGSQAQAVADKVLQTVSGNYQIRNHPYYSSCSLGVTVFNGNTNTDSHELLKHVEIALYQAKSTGRNTASFFDPSLQSAVHERANMVAELRSALQAKEFELYYQTQHDIKGEVVGAEALVRWHHGEKGVVSPGDFIPLAEESGLMIELGDLIVESGLLQLKDWQSKSGFNHLKLSLNLSVEQFYQEGFVERLEKRIGELGIDATRLMLEFTETTLIYDLAVAKRNILRLNKLGVRFAIDDFGTGYSSLNYLSELPLDQLKIDQSFVRHISDSPKDAAIVRAIIDMAHTLGLEVMAEGVETISQRDYLNSQGCTLYQGYLFSRPASVQSLDLHRRGIL